MNEIRIKTSISGDLIVQEVTGPGHDWKTMAREQIARDVMNTKDAQVREALIRMGWTPPEDRKKADDLADRLHSISKSLEGSGIIDQMDNPDAYGTILDAMVFVGKFTRK